MGAMQSMQVPITGSDCRIDAQCSIDLNQLYSSNTSFNKVHILKFPRILLLQPSNQIVVYRFPPIEHNIAQASVACLLHIVTLSCKNCQKRTSVFRYPCHYSLEECSSLRYVIRWAC